MIDFKTHISLFKRFSSDDDVDTYLKGLDLTERLRMTREIANTYPINDTKPPSKELFERFNVTTKVEDAVLGQFIMIEQIITGKTQFSDENQRELELAKLILRPKNHIEFDNEIEEDEIKNQEMILASPVQDIYSAIHQYLENRDFILFKQFSGVFYEIDDEEEEEEDKKEDKKEEKGGKGLSAAQKKLPEGLRKAIEAKKKK